MKEVLDAVEKDKVAGVHRRADGKLYFVQRKVEFSTIDFKPEYIFSNRWGIFQKPLEPIDWKLPIDKLEDRVLEFSIECSERFHYLWYYYIDIMLARSLSSNDKNIFIKDFLIPSIFLDLGIPENPLWTNVPKAIHQKILNEYSLSLRYKSNRRIFYLSQYLSNLTSDIIEYLKSYQYFWDLENKKLNAYSEIKHLITSIVSNQFFSFLKEKLNSLLKKNLLNNTIKFPNKIIETIYFQCKNDPHHREFSFLERRILLEYFIRLNSLQLAQEEKVENLNFLILLNEFTNFPMQLERMIRKISFLETFIFKEEIKKIRKIYIKYSKTNSLNFQLQEEFLKVTEQQTHSIEEKINLIAELTEYLSLHHVLYLETLIDLFKRDQIQTFKDLEFFFLKMIQNEISIKDDLKKEIFAKIKEVSTINKKIIEYYKQSFSLPVVKFIPNEKYKDKIQVQKFIPGNPFQEKVILHFFRELIKERLKPIRMASNEYSLLTKEKHGILTLNPVLKLWKNQIHFQKDLPELVQLELNTLITVDCLFELLFLVDPKLKEREIIRGKIVKEIRGKENIDNIKILLLPGSAYPLKEIPSSHFPEFKQKIIGEKRSYKEVGILETHYIVTGCWYNKKNHTLYYPIGGDNAELLKKIYLGIKSDVIPAFFFAIGQFVFECLSDTVLYYKNQKKTFREILYKLKSYQRNESKKKMFLYSKKEIKFEFSILYSQLIMENLTGSLHIQTKVPELYKWFFENLEIQSFFSFDKEKRKKLRIEAQNIIKKYDNIWSQLKKSDSNL